MLRAYTLFCSISYFFCSRPARNPYLNVPVLVPLRHPLHDEVLHGPGLALAEGGRAHVDLRAGAGGGALAAPPVAPVAVGVDPDAVGALVERAGLAPHAVAGERVLVPKKISHKKSNITYYFFLKKIISYPSGLTTGMM